MNFRFVVEVEVNRVTGKFATSEEIEQQIQDALENADPGSYEGENGGEYETADWSVNAEAAPKSLKPSALAAAAATRDYLAGCVEDAFLMLGKAGANVDEKHSGRQAWLVLRDALKKLGRS